MDRKLSNKTRPIEEAIFSRFKSIAQEPELCSNSNLNIYLANSRYIELISQWMKVFPREQFLILKSEDLFANPATTINQVFQFLEVKPYQLDEYKKVNSGSYSAISECDRHLLSDYFRPYNQQLEDYLGMKFNWE